MSNDIRLIHGDCNDVIKTLEDASVDAIVCDPPYAEITRDYGRMTEPEWHDMMHRLVPECRRVLKPHGSAVFILQPNSNKPGSMRPWLFEFQVYICKTWNMIQDAWWWNIAAIPEAHSIQGRYLRPSLKACVWAGPRDCYRDQDAVLWKETQANVRDRASDRVRNVVHPSKHHSNRQTMAAKAAVRGGVTPYNVLPMGNDGAAGSFGHGAGTPAKLCEWWIRYISPPGGTILDPFVGTGMTALAAFDLGRKAIGIERDANYFAIAEKRVKFRREEIPLFVNIPIDEPEIDQSLRTLFDDLEDCIP